MKAGRELDALVAEALGWEYVGGVWAGPKEGACGNRPRLVKPRAYSTEIGRAWDLLAWARAQPFSVRHRFFRALDELRFNGHSVAWPDRLALMKPEHFCLAALKAVGVDVEVEA